MLKLKQAKTEKLKSEDGGRGMWANHSSFKELRAYQTACEIDHFVSKLTDAGGELQETMHWPGRAAGCGYVTSERLQALEALCHLAG